MKGNASTPGGVDPPHVISEAPARPVASAPSASGGRSVIDFSTKTQALRAIDATGATAVEVLISEIRDRISSGRFATDYTRSGGSMLAFGQAG